MRRRTEFTGLAPQFVVPDVVAAAEWYRDKLGFELLGTFLDPPVYSMVRRGNAEIHFGRADGEKINNNEQVRRGLGTDAYIFVSDVNSLHEELIFNGVAILEGPTQRPYNCIEITIKDLNGFQIVFGE